MSLIMLIMVLCLIIVVGSIITESTSKEVVEVTEITNNEEFKIVTEHSKFVVEALKRKVLLVLQDEIPVDDKPTALVHLMCSLWEFVDTSDFIDEHPEIIKVITSY